MGMPLHPRAISRLAAGIVAMLVSAPVAARTWTNHTDACFVSGVAARDGLVWAATSGGLVRWDVAAQTYLKYTTAQGLADHDTKEALVDAQGRLWVGSTCGVQCRDGDTWTTYDTANSPLPDDRVYAIGQGPDGALWFGTGFGCARLDGTTWDVFTDLGGGATDVAVRGLALDAQGRVWTANNPTNYGAPGGVSMFDGATWTRFDPDPGGIGQLFLSLAVDEDDRVWAGSFTHGVFMYDGLAWTHYDASNSGLTGNIVEAIAAGPGPVVWIANHASSATPSNSGVARFSAGGWQSFTPANSGLTDTHVYALAVADGVTWMGTSRYGLVAFDGASWTGLDTVDEPHTNWFTSSAEGQVGAHGGLFLGTDHSGVAIWDGAAWSWLDAQNSGLGDNYVNDVAIHDGVLWVASQFQGLWRHDGATWTHYHTGNSGLLGDTIVSLDVDAAGVVWLGVTGWDGPQNQDGALTRFDGVTWTNYVLDNSGLVDDDGLQVAVDPQGVVWAGTEEGVSRFDGATWTTYDVANSDLLENHVQAIAFDAAGGTWLASRGGVNRLFQGAWASYTTADGLPGNNVAALAVGADGAVWAGTATGAAVLADAWTPYRQADGLADDDVTTILPSSAGPVWLGTERGGVSRFSPAGTAVGERPAAAGLALRAWPTPFNPATTIAFDLPVAGHVRLTAHDLRGRLVAVVAEAPFGAGRHEVTWRARGDDGRRLASGVYLLRLASGGREARQRVILLP